MFRHGLTLVLAGIAGAPAYAAGSDLSALEAQIVSIENAPTELATPPEPPLGTLRQLREPWITQARYRRLAPLCDRAPQSATPLVTGELYFRLARHAYLAGDPINAERCLAQIPDVPETNEWRAKGEYLSGVLALQKGDSAKATEHFNACAKLGEPSKEAWSSATLALARIAFDAGRLEEARNLYSQVTSKSPGYENGLEEAAWTYLKLGKDDLAATHVDLLFTLFPRSLQLPEAGYLLGRIRQERRNLATTAQLFEQLGARFEFEEASTVESLDAYKGREEEILFQLNPRLLREPQRTLLTPIGRALLESDPVARAYAAALTEIAEDRRELRRGLAVLDAAEELLRPPTGTTLEGMVLREKANRVEARALGVTEPSAPQLERVRSVRGQIVSLRKELFDMAEVLVAITRYFGINWMSLRGERAALALHLDQKVQKLIERAQKAREELDRLDLRSETIAILLRDRAARDQAASLRTQRANTPAADDSLKRLDPLRTKIETVDRARADRLARLIPEQRRTTQDVLRRIDSAEQQLLRQARSDIRTVLQKNRVTLARTLSRYRWSLGEARYQLFRANDREIGKARRQHAYEMARLEERYAPLLSRLSTPADFRLDANTERLRDAKHFLEEASLFSLEIREQIDRRATWDRDRYENFARYREEELQEETERQREIALLAYRELLRRDPTGDRVPYGLYRVGQLAYERAESIDRSYQSAAPGKIASTADFAAAVTPLEKLRSEFSDFPYRDSALYLLGYAQLQAGEKSRSVATFEQLVTESPRSKVVPEVQLRIGEHYFNERKFIQAIPHYQAVLSFGFNYFYDKALYKLAWSNYLIGRYDSAIAHFLILLDYSEQLSPEQRARFVEFGDEAVQYVAFSMHRAGGATVADRIFTKTGWKPYALGVTKRMAEIQLDRGDLRGAMASYDLAIVHFPTARELPQVIEARLQTEEKLADWQKVEGETRRAVTLFSDDSEWRRLHQKDVEATAAADRLLERALYSLATQLDAHRVTVAAEYYRKVAERFPESRAAYDARYRLGELAFAEKRFDDAVKNYDQVVRSGRFNHRFVDALYNIVVCREREASLEQLNRSVAIFLQRAPDDPRASAVLFRSASLMARAGRGADAREKYLRFAQREPNDALAQDAYLAAVDTHMATEEWDDAALLAGQVLKDASPLAEPTRTRLKSMREGALFKAAEAFNQKGMPQPAVQRYLEFQDQFSSSPLAPKAAFNAFAVAKRVGWYEPSQQALGVLIRRYPNTPEAASARFELAQLHDAAFETEVAIAEYEQVLASNPGSKEFERTISAIADLTAAQPPSEQSAEKLAKLAGRASPSMRATIELHAAEIAEEANAFATAQRIRESIARRTETSPPLRAKAAAESARVFWDSGDESAASRLERLAEETIRQSRKAQADEARLALAETLSAHIAARRRQAESIKLDGRSVQRLAATFKEKASTLSSMERLALRILEYKSALGSASALYHLGAAYHDFVRQLQALIAPPERKEEFAKSVADLVQPLQQKAKQTLEKSYALLVQERLPQEYLAALLDELNFAGVKAPAAPATSAQWIPSRLPRPPLFLDRDLAKPETQTGSLMSPLSLLAVPAAIADAPANAALQEGIRQIKSIWNKEERTLGAEAFRKALYAAPASTAATYNLAILQIYDGDFGAGDTSMAWLRSRADALPPGAMDRLAATVSILRGHPRDAENHLRRTLQANPSDDEAGRLLVAGLLEQKRPTEALEEARSLLRQNLHSASTHRAIGEAFEANGSPRLRRLALERAETIAPNDPNVAMELALTFSRVRETPLRSTILSKLSSTADPEIRANWAKLAFDVRDVDTACKEWEAIMQIGGRFHPSIVQNLALCQPTEEKRP